MRAVPWGRIGFLMALSLAVVACRGEAPLPLEAPLAGAAEFLITVEDLSAGEGLIAVPGAGADDAGRIVFHTNEDGAPGLVIGLAPDAAAREREVLGGSEPGQTPGGVWRGITPFASRGRAAGFDKLARCGSASDGMLQLEPGWPEGPAREHGLQPERGPV